MGRKSDNVILFPRLKQTLEHESLLALEQKKYHEALEKLNKLLEFDNQKHEILIGKVICLMELHWYEEAQELCEKLLKHNDAHYYHYLHIYLTILFQTNQYQLLMEEVEFALKDKSISTETMEMFQQLYEMSKNMQYDIHLEQTHRYVKELTEAINDNDHQKQWRLIDRLRHLKTAPPHELYAYLSQDIIHPVVKTIIFQWLQQSGVSEIVTVRKDNEQVSIRPDSFPLLKEHSFLKQMTLLLGDHEQKSPTTYYLIEKLLYRYAYVWYPVLPEESDIRQIGIALQLLGEQYLQNKPLQMDQVNEGVEKYMKDIQLCEALYLSILDD